MIPPDVVILTEIDKDEWDFEIKFSKITDEQDDEVEATADLGMLKDYLRFDDNGLVLKRYGTKNPELLPAGVHYVLIELTDDNESGSLSKFYQIALYVKHKYYEPEQVIIIEEEVEKPIIIEPKEVIETEPIIKEITNDGIVKLVFEGDAEIDLNNFNDELDK